MISRQKKIKDFKRVIIKSIDKFNSYIKQDIKKKDIEKKDTVKEYIEHDANNNKVATSDDIKAHIIDKQKLIKQRYISLLETKKTIKNNIELINSALKKLPKEPQPNLIELVRLDTMLYDSINVIWCEIYERDKKGLKKIDVNKIKNVDTLYII